MREREGVNCKQYAKDCEGGEGSLEGWVVFIRLKLWGGGMRLKWRVRGG